LFDKSRFSKVLQSISEQYENQREFAKKSGINRTYISKYINQKIDTPPNAELLFKLAKSANGLIDYLTLMQIAGYFEKNDYDSIIKYGQSLNETYGTNIDIDLIAEKTLKQLSLLNLTETSFDLFVTYTIEKAINNNANFDIPNDVSAKEANKIIKAYNIIEKAKDYCDVVLFPNKEYSTKNYIAHLINEVKKHKTDIINKTLFIDSELDGLISQLDTDKKKIIKEIITGWVDKSNNDTNN
jgi:transcriptional regulator with XRE-family HTH domain